MTSWIRGGNGPPARSMSTPGQVSVMPRDIHYFSADSSVLSRFPCCGSSTLCPKQVLELGPSFLPVSRDGKESASAALGF